MDKYKIISLAIWFIVATAIVRPVYVNGGDDDRLRCICLVGITTLYGLSKIMD